MKSLLIVIILTEALTQSIEDDLYRRSYGQSFNDGCPNYEMVYKCMSICKKINGAYRINRRCQCRCHSTISKLKYLKKKTNGTTIKIPKTFSPGIFDIVGTFSIPYYLITTTTTTSPNVTCETTKPPISSTTPSSKGIQNNNFRNNVTNKTIPENNIIHNNKSNVYNINRNTRTTSTVKVKSSFPHGVSYGNNFTTPNANENITVSGSNGIFTAPPQSIVNNSDTIITSKEAKEKVEKEKGKDQVEKGEKKTITNKTIPENNIIHNNKSNVYNINRNTRTTSTVKVKSSFPHGVSYGNNFTTPNANENITVSGSNGIFTAPPQSIVNNSDTIITSKEAKEKVEKEKGKDQVEKGEKKIGGDVEKNKDIGEDKMENRDEQDEKREEKVENVGNVPEGITETSPNVTTQGSVNEAPKV